MFYALAIALCLAVAFIVAAGSSVLCALALAGAGRWLRYLSPRARSNTVFTLRVLPLLLAVLVPLGFALPAFLRFEPPTSNEGLGLRLLTLGLLGAAISVMLLLRSGRIIRATRWTQRQCRMRSRIVEIEGVSVPIFVCALPAPLLFVAGVFRPQIFIAEEVLSQLSPAEIFAAIAHELAHVSAWDNVKQMLLKITAGPRWLRFLKESDSLWLQASEMSADDGAVERGASVLDLSSALIKVAALHRLAPATHTIAASHFLPEAAKSCVESRIDRLCKLLEKEKEDPGAGAPHRRWAPALSLIVFVFAYAACVHAVLPWMHEMLELLVR